MLKVPVDDGNTSPCSPPSLQVKISTPPISSSVSQQEVAPKILHATSIHADSTTSNLGSKRSRSASVDDSGEEPTSKKALCFVTHCTGKQLQSVLDCDYLNVRLQSS